jgi:glycine cleavage system regulatory protein
VSIPLKDLRTSVDESTDMWLEVEASVQRKDKAAISREVLRAWAKQKAHAYKLATKKLQAHGIQPELFGDDTEDDGTRTADAGMSRSRK